MLIGIYLCQTCSCHEIEDGNVGAGAGHQPPITGLLTKEEACYMRASDLSHGSYAQCRPNSSVCDGAKQEGCNAYGYPEALSTVLSATRSPNNPADPLS
jgi:hypothetical protein